MTGVEPEMVPLLKAVVPRRPACGERDRIPFPSLRLFSATTLMDFSYTFHNFTVLSINKKKVSINQRCEILVDTVCGEEEVCCVLSSAPFYFIDFLFYFEGFEVVEFGFVRLEFIVEFVFASFLLFLNRVSS